jgi:hypothetical protein
MSNADTSLTADLRAVIVPWLSARVLLITAYVAALAIADRVLPGARPTQLTEGLVAWDGTWYRDIAAHGYSALPQESLRFFPLFPMLGRGLGLLTFGREDIALVLIANVCALLVLVMVRRLMRREGAEPRAVDRALWYFVLFPGAFVLGWAYAESLWLLAAVSLFVAIRSQRWLWAVLAGFVAGLSRPLGVVLAVPVAVELVRSWRDISVRERIEGSAAVVSPVVGTGIYMLWVRGVFDDLWLPFSVQSDLRGSGTDPISRLWEGLTQLFGPERLGDGLHIPFAVAFVALLVVVFRRLPVSYGLFAALVLATSLATENLNSLERYGLNAFPIVLALAILCRDREIDSVVRITLAGGFVALASMAWMGAYVP